MESEVAESGLRPAEASSARTDQGPRGAFDVPGPSAEPEVAAPATDAEIPGSLTTPEIPEPATETEAPDAPIGPEAPEPATAPEQPDLGAEPETSPIPGEADLPDPLTVAEPTPRSEIADPNAIEELPLVESSEISDQRPAQETPVVVPLEASDPREQSEPSTPADPRRTDAPTMDAAEPEQGSQTEHVEHAEHTDPEPADQAHGPLEGHVEVHVYDSVTGDEIAEIDRIENDILWEEKSARDAINPITGRDETARWIQKHLEPKVDRYINARPELPEEYHDAQIGFDFVLGDVDPGFRSAVENEVARLRVEHPDIEIHLRWRS